MNNSTMIWKGIVDTIEMDENDKPTIFSSVSGAKDALHGEPTSVPLLFPPNDLRYLEELKRVQSSKGSLFLLLTYETQPDAWGGLISGFIVYTASLSSDLLNGILNRRKQK